MKFLERFPEGGYREVTLGSSDTLTYDLTEEGLITIRIFRRKEVKGNLGYVELFFHDDGKPPKKSHKIPFDKAAKRIQEKMLEEVRTWSKEMGMWPIEHAIFQRASQAFQ